MTPSQVIVLSCWGIFFVYWVSNWRNVKPTQEKKFNMGKFRGLMLGIVALIWLNHFVFHNALNLPVCQWYWSGCHYQSTSLASSSLLLQMLSIILAILGLVIAVVARKTLAGNWSASLDVKKGHELITTGIYSYIRHPIYTGVVTLLFATLLAFSSINGLIIFLVVTITLLFRIKQEEELMTKIFSKEYPAYKKRTKTLIPFVW